MRWVFAAWAFPMIVLWGWFSLSYYDINFGYIMLSRQVHDLVFEIYGNQLGIDPKTVPWLVAKVCVIDTLAIVAIWAFRRRRNIVAWFRGKRDGRHGRAALHRGGVLAQPLNAIQHALQDKRRGRRIDLVLAAAARKIHLDQAALGRNRR